MHVQTPVTTHDAAFALLGLHSCPAGVAMLAIAVARARAAEIATLLACSPCVRMPDLVVCAEKGLVVVLLGHIL